MVTCRIVAFLFALILTWASLVVRCTNASPLEGSMVHNTIVRPRSMQTCTAMWPAARRVDQPETRDAQRSWIRECVVRMRAYVEALQWQTLWQQAARTVSGLAALGRCYRSDV